MTLLVIYSPCGAIFCSRRPLTVGFLIHFLTLLHRVDHRARLSTE